MISTAKNESDERDEPICCDDLRDIVQELDSAKEQIASLERQLSVGRCDFLNDDCFAEEMLFSENRETAL